MKVSPCKDCIARTVGCHSTCKMYIEWTIKYKEASKKEQDARAYDYLSHSLAVDSIKRRGGWRR